MSTSRDNDAEALASRRRAIEAKLEEIEATSVSAAGGIGFGKRVGEGTNIAVQRFADVAVHRALRAELATVVRAEQRLAAGIADRCDDCGRVIPAERLEAIPWAVTCVGCAT